MTEARHAVVASRRVLTVPVGRVRTGASSSRVADSASPAQSIPEQGVAGDWFTGRFNAARVGDNVAFADVYREIQPRLYRYAVTLVGREAEDVTAEAWLQIARDLRRFTGDAQAFRVWAAAVVRNRAIDHLRVAARRPAVLVETAELERPSDSDTEARAAELISTAAALELIATLPREQAEAVLLRTVMGLDATAVAKILGKRPGAVRVATHRGLRALGRLLDQDATAGRQSAGPDIGRKYQ